MEPVTFNPWIPHVHEVKYTKSDWINNELHRYFTAYPNNTYREAEIWMNTGIDAYLNKLREDMKISWKSTYLQKICKRIRKNIRTDAAQELSGYKLGQNNISKVVNNIAFYMRDYSFMDNIKILDSLSLHSDVNSTYQDIQLNWGQCIMSIISQQHALDRCDMYNQYRYSKMTKETIIGAMIYLDEEGYFCNRGLINKLCSIKRERLDNIKLNRIKFNTNQCKVISDQKYNQKVFRGFDRFPKPVKEHIYQFWIDISVPDPSPSKSIILDHSKRDQNRNKIREQKRYIKHTYLELYKIWFNEKGGKEICDRHDCYVYPEKPMFVRERPKEIRFENISNRIVCKKHFNFEQMALAFNNITENRHLCGTRFCRNYANNQIDDVCRCITCLRCPLLKGLFKGTADEVIHKIFCDNGKEWPYYDCTLGGSCGKVDCGINIIKGILNNTLCPTFSIRPETIVEYDYIEQCKDTEKRKHHEVKNVRSKWCHFISKFMKKILIGYIEHSMQYQLGHHKRSRLSKHSPERPNKLRLDQLLSSWDYISAIVVKNSINPTNSFADTMTITYLEIFQIINNNGKLIKSSHCYMSDCSEGSWNMAVAAAKLYYPTSINRLRAINHVQARQFINYSDGTTKDFRCTSCLAFIGNIARDNDVFNEWNFTAAEEAKWIHDREGGTIVRVAYYLMRTGKVKSISGRTYTSCLIDALREYFGDERFNKIERFFYEILEKDISNISSPHKTLSGITKYYSLLTYKRHHVYYRPYPCSCDNCMNYRWGQCQQIDICGAYGEHKFDENIPYPTRINLDQLNHCYDDNPRKKRRIDDQHVPN